MRTKPVGRTPSSATRLDEALKRPHTWQVMGVDAFWIETGGGKVLSEEFPDTGPAFDAALAAMAHTADIEDIVLVGRARGERVEVTRGVVLRDLAEAHAGLPARPRVPVNETGTAQHRSYCGE